METAQNKNLIPNSTQIPHIIIREWMPLLKDAELRVLLVVADQTLGWLEDAETGRRKEKDWISLWQLQQKTGRGERAVTKALHILVDDLKIVQATSDDGTVLDTPAKRAGVGKRIFYRLNLHHPQAALMPTPAESARVKRHNIRTQKRAESQYPRKKDGPQKVRPTKLTVSTKLNTAKAADADFDKKDAGEKPNKTEQPAKIPTIELLAAFKRYSEKIRHETPAFERGKDGSLIKAALRHLTRDQIELLFLWYLTSQIKMGVSIGGALCRESIDGFLDATRNEQGFYLRMSDLWKVHNKTVEQPPDAYRVALKLKALKAQMLDKMSLSR